METQEVGDSVLQEFEGLHWVEASKDYSRIEGKRYASGIHKRYSRNHPILIVDNHKSMLHRTQALIDLRLSFLIFLCSTVPFGFLVL